MLPRHPSHTLRYALATGAAATLLASAAPPTHADAGDVDTGFVGRATGALGQVPGGNAIRALAVRPDGRIIAVSLATGPSDTSDIVVHRLLPDGSPDPSFDGDGHAVIDSAAREDVQAVALQSDGKIVLAGRNVVAGGGADLAVFRLKADGGDGGVNGALDPTFDADGAAGVNTDGDERAAAVAIQTDGKIVVAGTAYNRVSHDNVVVYRLKANGGNDTKNNALDPTFDVDGVAGVDSGRIDEARGLVLRPDGRIVVVATTTTITGDRQDGVVFQLRANGGNDDLNEALDSTFDSDGKAVLTVGGYTTAGAAALQPDGALVVVGSTNGVPGGTDATVWRLRPDGGTDGQFGQDGLVLLDAGGDEVARGVAAQPDGRIVAGGDSLRGFEDMAAFRLLPGGRVDPAFGGGDGIATYDSGVDDIGYALALQPDGGVLVGGLRTTAPTIGPELVRFLGDPPDQPAPTPSTPAASPSPVGRAVTAPGGVATSGRRTSQRRTARFAAATRVSVRRTGRRVRLANRNAFRVSVRLRAGRAKPKTVALAAGATRTVTVRVRGRLRVTATDPAGTTRPVAVRSPAQKSTTRGSE